MSIHKVTARDVAERAGVSRSLVSMYLNRNPRVWISEETKQRIDEAIRSLGYRPNPGGTAAAGWQKPYRRRDSGADFRTGRLLFCGISDDAARGCRISRHSRHHPV